jgi:hypothetical protein
MSTASRSGSGEETTSANVVRNPPASVSGSCIVRSSGTNRIGRRIATGSSDRNLPRAASRLYCRQCDNGEFVQGRVADFSRRRDSNGCQARTGRMQRGRRTATIGSVPLSPWSACYQVVSGSPASFVSASGIEKGALVSAVETDEIERGNAVVIAGHRCEALALRPAFFHPLRADFTIKKSSSFFPPLCGGGAAAAYRLFRTCHARWVMAAPSQMSSIPSNTPRSHAAETGMLAHR